MTFFTDKRWEKDVHPHESPAVMTGPLRRAAALAVFGGLLILNDWIVDWLSPVTGHCAPREPADPGAPRSRRSSSCWSWPAPAVAAGRRPAGGPADRADPGLLGHPGRSRGGLRQRHQRHLVVDPGRHLTAGVLATDRYVVDGAHRGPVAIGAVAGVARRAQNGFVAPPSPLLGGASSSPLACWR